ncbi:MAG: hypothetical protein RL351_608, partial [Actinomycetota bacterium]
MGHFVGQVAGRRLGKLSPMNIDWDAIVKTYDVRGLVGKSLTTEIVAALAAGFVDEL